MRAAIAWTAELDDKVCGLRRSGLTWDRIAEALGLSRNTVLERGRKIGARRLRPPPQPREPVEAKDRPPRQAGHPQTWGLLTDGTVLEGEAYPYPVFL